MGGLLGNSLLTQLIYKVQAHSEVEVNCPSGFVVMDVSGTNNSASFFISTGYIYNFVSSATTVIDNTDASEYCVIKNGSSNGKIKLYNKSSESFNVFLSVQRTSE